MKTVTPTKAVHGEVNVSHRIFVLPTIVVEREGVGLGKMYLVQNKTTGRHSKPVFLDNGGRGRRAAIRPRYISKATIFVVSPHVFWRNSTRFSQSISSQGVCCPARYTECTTHVTESSLGSKRCRPRYIPVVSLKFGGLSQVQVGLRPAGGNRSSKNRSV